MPPLPSSPMPDPSILPLIPEALCFPINLPPKPGAVCPYTPFLPYQGSPLAWNYVGPHSPFSLYQGPAFSPSLLGTLCPPPFPHCYSTPTSLQLLLLLGHAAHESETRPSPRSLTPKERLLKKSG
ncbi:hypothetical protein DR999_PMT17471 [Platysternon megacephalum]|uniref:Uncharacterized protein n=1 Tax=Platysternon megacephalum TaxID=55544 RepID=A0A4D9DS85_9SAUR|nr:hypothetical protein DR999_PMT17471 [Platysternon megacephalum]